jgi:hypothetical protein
VPKGLDGTLVTWVAMGVDVLVRCAAGEAEGVARRDRMRHVQLRDLIRLGPSYENSFRRKAA